MFVSHTVCTQFSEKSSILIFSALKGKELGYSFYVCYLKGKTLLGRQ